MAAGNMKSTSRTPWPSVAWKKSLGSESTSSSGAGSSPLSPLDIEEAPGASQSLSQRDEVLRGGPPGPSRVSQPFLRSRWSLRRLSLRLGLLHETLDCGEGCRVLPKRLFQSEQ